MLEHYGISMVEYNRRKQRGLTLEEILTTPDKNEADKLGIRDGRGNTYKSWADLARACELAPSIVSQRVHMGWDVLRIIETPALGRGCIEGIKQPSGWDQDNIKRCTDHTGRQFKSLKSMCKYWDISIETYKERLKRGWDLGKILTDRIGLPEHVWSDGGQFRDEPQPEYTPKKRKKPKIADGHEDVKLITALWDSEKRLARADTEEAPQRQKGCSVRPRVTENHAPAVPVPPCDLKPSKTSTKRVVIEGTGKWNYDTPKKDTAVNCIPGYVEVIGEDGTVEKQRYREDDEFAPLTPMIETTDSLEKREIGVVQKGEFSSTRYKKIDLEINERIQKEQLEGLGGQLEMMADSAEGKSNKGFRHGAPKVGSVKYNSVVAGRKECLFETKKLLERTMDLLSKVRAATKLIDVRTDMPSGNTDLAHKHLAKLILAEAYKVEVDGLIGEVKDLLKIGHKRIEQGLGIGLDDGLDEIVPALEDVGEMLSRGRKDLSLIRKTLKPPLIRYGIIENTPTASKSKKLQACYKITSAWDTEGFNSDVVRAREHLEQSIHELAVKELKKVKDELILEDVDLTDTRSEQAADEVSASRESLEHSWTDGHNKFMEKVMAEVSASKARASEQRSEADRAEAKERRKEKELDEVIKKQTKAEAKQAKTEQEHVTVETKQIEENQITKEEFMDVFGSLGIQIAFENQAEVQSEEQVQAEPETVEVGAEAVEVEPVEADKAEVKEIEAEPIEVELVEAASVQLMAENPATSIEDNKEKPETKDNTPVDQGETPRTSGADNKSEPREPGAGGDDSDSVAPEMVTEHQLTEEQLLINLLNYREWLMEDGGAVLI